MAAFASDAPSPATVAACQAEAAQLGKDAFLAKYGPTEAFGHCYAAHATAATSQDSPAVAACKAEYLQLGATAFTAKYGATEALGNCVKAKTTVTKPEQPKGDDGATSAAGSACSAEAKALGKDGFVKRYGGHEAMGACIKNALAKAKAFVASCKDAYKACIAAGAGAPAPKRR